MVHFLLDAAAFTINRNSLLCMKQNKKILSVLEYEKPKEFLYIVRNLLFQAKIVEEKISNNMCRRVTAS